MKHYLIVLFAVMLCAGQALAINVVRGKMTLGADGNITFDGYIQRDNMNVSLSALNSARETPPKESQYVYMTFEGSALEQKGDYWYFSLLLEQWFDDYDLLIKFPEGAKFKEISSNVQYTTDGSALHFKTTLVENPRIDAVYSLAVAEQPQYWYLALVALAIIAAALLSATLVFRRRKRRALDGGILEHLNPRERGIVTALFEGDGKMTQTRLRQKTGMPKSTLSNALRDLENRKLVSRFEHGSTFDVELEKKLYK